MTAATSTATTAPPPTQPPVSSGLRLPLDPAMAGTGAVDGGWWPRSRDPDAELPGLITGLDSSLGPITRVALNLAMAADPTNSAGPADILAAAGIGGQDPAPMSPK